MSKSGDNKSEYCISCLEGVSLLKAAAAVMTSNAQITTELVELHGALGPWAAVPNPDIGTAAEKPVATIGGSGAGSVEVYKQIMKKNGRGRLGRTHMEDVDRLLETARNELDTYLRRTIHNMFPVDRGHSEINADAVFATLSAFGLGLEDRNPLADVVVFGDTVDKPPIARLQNLSAHFCTAGTNKFELYWKGYALETLLELARYRGLFGNDGYMRTVE